MVTSLQYLTLALSAVAVIMLLGLLFIYHQAPPQPTTTPTPTPQPSPSVCAYAAPAHTAAEAKAYLSRVMAAYTEMMRSQVPDPTYDGCDKTWSAVIRIPATGGERRTYIRINDTPALMLDNTYLEIVKAVKASVRIHSSESINWAVWVCSAVPVRLKDLLKVMSRL